MGLHMASFATLRNPDATSSGLIFTPLVSPMVFVSSANFARVASISNDSFSSGPKILGLTVIYLVSLAVHHELEKHTMFRVKDALEVNSHP